MNDTSSLSHTTWNCKYHIVFAPKYRRKIFYQENKKEIGEILRRLCQLTLTRITHQGSHMIDLNVKKKNRRVKRLISLHIEKKKDKMNSREHQYS